MNWIDELEKIDMQGTDGLLTEEAHKIITTALQEAHTKGVEEALKPFKGALNPGEWEDSVWHEGKKVGTQEALAKVEEWYEQNYPRECGELSDTGTCSHFHADDVAYAKALDDLLHHLQQLKDNKAQ